MLKVRRFNGANFVKMCENVQKRRKFDIFTVLGIAQIIFQWFNEAHAKKFL